MKLSNKEKVILAVFLAVVIIVAGVFLIILPEYNKISTNQSALDGAKAQREQLYQTLTREETIDKEIETAVTNANVFSGYFYDDMTTYEADAIVRQILADNNMETDSLSIGDFTTSTLTVSEYVEAIVSYPLKEYSGYVPDAGIDFSQYEIQYDENGNVIVPEELKDIMKEFINTLLTTQQQTLGSISVSFTAKGTRREFLDFLDNIAKLEKATYVPGVSVVYTGTEGNAAAPAALAAEPPAEGGNGDQTGAEQPNPPANNTETQITDDTEISANITLVLYCAKALQTEAVTEASAAQTTQPTEVA